MAIPKHIAEQTISAYELEMAKLKNAMKNNQYNTITSETWNGVVNAPRQRVQPQLAFADARTLEKSSVMNVPLSNLRDLWLARYGSGWVSPTNEDDFFSMLLTRLQAVGQVEVVFLERECTTVYRLV
jgi:hypothetical protein